MLMRKYRLTNIKGFIGLVILFIFLIGSFSSAQQVSETDYDKILNSIESIEFAVEEGIGVVNNACVIVDAKSPVDYDRIDGENGRLSLRLKNVVVPRKLQMARDVADYASPVSFVYSVKDPLKENDLLLVMEYKDDYREYVEHDFTRNGNSLRVCVRRTSLNIVESIDFKTRGETGILTIDAESPLEYEEIDIKNGKLSLRLKDVAVSRKLQLARDVADQESPVSFISSFRDAEREDSLLVVIEYKDDYKEYVEHDIVSGNDGRLTISLNKTDLNIVESIDFESREGMGILTIDAESPLEYEEIDIKNGKLSLRLKDVAVSRKLQLARDVADQESPVSFISSFRDAEREDSLLVVIEYKDDYKEYVEHDIVSGNDGRLTISLNKTDLNIVESIDFESREGMGILTIDAESPLEYEEIDIKNGKLSLRLKDVAVSRKLQLARDVADQESPVSFISSFRDAEREDSLLVVIEYKDDYKEYVEHDIVSGNDGRLTISLNKTDLNIVESIDFESREGMGILTIDAESPLEYEKMDSENGRLSLKLKDIVLNQKFQVSRDVRGYDSPVSFISSFRDPVKDSDVLIIVDFKQDGVKHELSEDANGLAINFEKIIDEEEDESLKFTEDLWAFDFRYSPPQDQLKQYRGSNISIDFKNADVRDVVKNLADIGGFNIVIARDVQGEITIKLNDLPWDQALDIIFGEAELGGTIESNVLRISSLRSLRVRQRTVNKDNQLREQLEPLVTEQKFVSYAKAEDIQSLANPLLSDRGSMRVDVRTNSILVTDTVPRVREVVNLLDSLDTRTPQVLIESRIVEANMNFARQLGVQWGFNYTASAGTGNPTGAVFPSRVGLGGSNVSAGPGGSTGDSFIVDLPAAAGRGAGAAFGIVLGSITGAYDLDLRLSALETNRQGRTLSSPKVLTLNNNTARIEQGVSIPFLSVSAAGTQTEFVDATLKLEVTPQVTNDNRVLMNIRVTNNAPDDTVASQQPSIRRSEAETQTLAGDGETVVIGGIYTKTVSDAVASVPWFSRIPLFGWLFQNQSIRDERRELLVFITPRIIR